MSHRKELDKGIILLLVLFVLFMGASSRRDTAVASTDERPDVPPYGLPGPHVVGQRTLEISNESPLEIKIWYPALPDRSLEEAAAYPYEIKMGAPLGTITIAASTSRATPDAAFDLTKSPYPMVILSPGFAVGASSYGWLAEHLASYGFVVIAPEHDEHLDPENELWQAAVTRSQDILAVFAYVDAAVEPGAPLDGLIDPNVVAVIGHSYGGYTALAAAGAQIDTTSFETHCERAARDEDPTLWLCDMLLPHMDEMADLAGLEAVPEGLWPDWSDTRVDAIVPMAGDAYFFGQPGLVQVTVPVMAIGGTRDSDTPILWGTNPTYENISSLTRARVALHDAEHMIFTNTCEAVKWYAKPVAGEFCIDSLLDRKETHDLVNHLTTAFLLSELERDPAAAAVLVPDAVELPGLTYEAQGY